MCEYACGKLPNWRLVEGSNISANRPRWLEHRVIVSWNRSKALSVCPRVDQVAQQPEAQQRKGALRLRSRPSSVSSGM